MSPPCSSPPVSGEPNPGPSDCRKLALNFHHESTFHSNDDQKWMWAEKGKQAIKPKSQGQGIMVNDFIDEHNGYLCLNDKEYEREKGSHTGLWKEARSFLEIVASRI